jgi:hypothetical protein
MGAKGFLPELTTEVERVSLIIEIGGMRARVNSTDHDFLDMLQQRYSGYVASAGNSDIEFDMDLVPPGHAYAETEVCVSQHGGRWSLTRGDFRAEWQPAKQGGFLLHSASAIRNGKAFLFAGVSEAGKTTISRLAPRDVTLLTDEISYVRRRGEEYVAFGTPFTGELAKLGENVSAPIAALYLLGKGPDNRIDPVPAGEAVRSLLSNLLFFAKDEELVQTIFHTAFEFVRRVPVSRLTFFPDARVWELIR